MRYHNITKDDMLNGDGLRVVLWVAGCNHCCKNCQNPITWDPDGGLPFDEAAKAEIFEQLDKSYISGITFSGGDPLHPANRLGVREFMAEIKEKYPQIKLILVLPCKDQTRGWYDSDIKKYNEILSRADKVVYIAERYYDGCMLKRNRHLVDNSGYCIYYLKRDGGGTAYTVNYAKQNWLIIFTL